jgi:altronate dehydratase small subunit
MGKQKAIVMETADNVATAVEEIGPGAELVLEIGGGVIRIVVREHIPFGHKFSLAVIHRGDSIVKYGQPIGKATADIEPGRHVHVHNLESNRGRGDR